MNEETASKLITTIRSIRLQLQMIAIDLDAMERAVADEARDD